MRKILLVDDETFVLDGIHSCLPWKELGIDEVFTAQNGMQALEVLNTVAIDLMITDVKMPVMDGIELIRKMHAQNYPCKVIVLSGFDNFKFAQEAITYNVVEYILKPITLQKLRNAVEKAIVIVEQEESNEAYLQALEQQFEASRPVLTEHFVSELLAGNQNSGLAKLLGFDTSAAGYVVAVFHIDNFEAGEDVSLTVLETKRQMAVLAALNSVTDHTFDNATYLTVRVGSYDFALVLMLQSVMGVQLPKQLLEQLEALQAKLSLNKPYTFSIGIGNIQTNEKQVVRSYEEALDALKHKLFTGSGSLIAYSDIYKATEAGFPQLTWEKAQVRNCLHTRDLSKLEAVLSELQSQIMRDQAQDVGYIRQMAMEFVIAATLFLYEKNELTENVICHYKNPVLYVSRLETIEEIFGAVHDIYSQVIEFLNCKCELKNQHTIQIIREFVQENLGSDISLETLSQRIQLTPNYIGALFKQATNMYFSDYVMRERMERAKVLLANPACRIYEVAAAVGYKNATYFSKLFKDYTGFSPVDFKK